MKEILLTIMPAALWLIAGAEVVLCILLFRIFREKRSVTACLSGLISVGLMVDALMLALGTIPGLAPRLGTLSYLRFILHGLLIPLLLPIAAEAVHLKHRKIVWAVTALLMALGMLSAFGTRLEPVQTGAVLRFASGSATPAWANALSGALAGGLVIPLMLAGLVVWKREKKASLFWSGFLMFFFAALPPALGLNDLMFFISMPGELFMVLFLYLFVRT